jgi:branched-chain amino acid transport system permease protein
VRTIERFKKPVLFCLPLVVLIIILPSMVSNYYVGLAIQMFIMAIFAMSLDLLVGYTGLPSLGHAAYFGVAGYATGFLYLAGVKSFWIVVVIAMGLAGLTAALFGLLAIRARGPYFLIITLALAQVVWGIAFKWRSFTKGDDGLPGIGRPDLGLGIDFKPDPHFYYLAFAIFLVVLILLFLLVHSPFGYTLRGIRESESRMKALGYHVWLYQYLAFIFSGAFAGISGVLWVYYSGFVNPSDLSIDLSVRGLLMLILGGAGSLIGPALGAGIIVLLANLVSGFTERWSLLLGIIYIVVIMVFSKGIFFAVKKRAEG